MSKEALKDVLKELHDILGVALSYYKHTKADFIAQAKIKELSNNDIRRLINAGYSFDIEHTDEYILITIN